MHPQTPVSAPRAAATVILLRDAPGGPETWLLRRVPRMAFAAGMSVFPGGAVDSSDSSPTVPWAGPAVDADAERYGCSVAEARALLVAAVREVWEETGVLLTQPLSAGAEVDLAGQRLRVESREVSFERVLVDAGLAVAADRVRPWSHWLTPARSTRRFDTYFYVAELPAGARAQADSGEAVAAGWIRPLDALAEFRAGERPLMPPTVVTLWELSGFVSTADVLAAAENRTLALGRANLAEQSDGSRRLILPDGTEFQFPLGLRANGLSGPEPGVPA